MCMWRLVKGCVFLGLWFFIVSCSSSYKIALEENAKGRLSEIPYPIGIELAYAQVKKCWYYSITKGEMTLKRTWECLPGWIGNEPNYIDFQHEIPEGLPKIEGYYYKGPYSLSPDKSLILMSISPEKKYKLSNNIVLIRRETKEIIRQTNTDDSGSQKTGIYFIIRSVSWSSDSRYFAVLETKNRRSHSFMHTISAMAGHPIDEYTYYLYVYNREGQLLVKSEIASGIYGGDGRVFWEGN